MGRLSCRFAAVAFAIFTASAPICTATTVESFDLPRLVSTADFVIEARVVSNRTEWVERAGNKAIYTWTTVDVVDQIVGETPKRFELRFSGGQARGLRMAIDSMPELLPGEHVILFVEGNGKNVSPLAGFFQGRFRVVTDPGGQERILDFSGAPIHRIQDVGTPAAARSRGAAQPLSKGDFIRAIRGEAARRGK